MKYLFRNIKCDVCKSYNIVLIPTQDDNFRVKCISSIMEDLEKHVKKLDSK